MHHTASTAWQEQATNAKNDHIDPYPNGVCVCVLLCVLLCVCVCVCVCYCVCVLLTASQPVSAHKVVAPVSVPPAGTLPSPAPLIPG